MARLGSLRRSWERFGRSDPYWAVLTDRDKRGGKWHIDEFFESGAREITAVLERASAAGMAVARGRALDFGCGAGRLTQALAAHFDRADGVDVSASMLEIARRHNRKPDRCAYHLNTEPDLSLFPDRSFDFIYSTLVLQHIEPAYSTGYIRELVRVLAPDGLLVFQLPSQRSGRDPAVEASQTRVPGRLPAGAQRARIEAAAASIALEPGEEFTVDVTIANRSEMAWPALPDELGRRQINVGNHWLSEYGEMLRRDDGRCGLGFDLGPGGETSVMLIVEAPRDPGNYLLEIDLVQEDVGWFAEQGSHTLRVPVTVGDAAPGRRERPAVAPPTRFSLEHPRAFRFLKATGIRAMYWSWRRGLDRVKSTRDRAVIAIRDGLYLPRLRNWWRRGPLSPVMEMHCVPRAAVEKIVTAAGARVAAVDVERVPGYQSCRYWIVKGGISGVARR